MRTGAVRHMTTLSGLAVLLSCADTPRGSTVLVADSLGVRVVEHTQLPVPDMSASAPVSAELSFGGSNAQPGQELTYVRGAVPILGDRLFVADQASDGIRSFDLVRAEVRGFGARGEGPGEFLYPAMVGIHDGDSVVVYDARSRRVSLLDTSRGGHRSFLVPPEVGPFASAVGLLSTGHIVFSGSNGLRLLGHERVVRDTVPVVVTDLEGAVQATFEEIRSAGYYEGPPDVNPRALAIPFAPGDRVLAGPGGIYVTREDRAEIRRYDGTGSLILVLRLALPPFEVRGAQVDSVLDAEAESSNYPEGVRRLFDRMPIPGQHPPISQMVLDNSGRIWVLLTSDTRDPTSTWALFEADGSFVGWRELPSGRLMGVTNGRAVLETHDEYDAPILSVLRIAG